ncbi:DMT family transporter [Rugosimonospora africana]|uniref:QacE family quaternary ammonium compound efflux SMR transporter n=1 Tax=Rugosimonospora africana TaxID=556532 RepID=A0A8J3VTC9_9ACTN|nr:multidrug efflux SMR transporter [Rugosimonospora africana]GIH17531.1 QacE family quaternary ammonium compound efflux SMR transporter [Rugosimonospora africana]
MPYLLLALAIGTEIGATTLLKVANGFTRLWPSVGVVIGYVLSFILLGQVLKSLPVSLVYAIWSGAGTAAVAAIGLALFHEPVSWLKIGGIALVIAGVVALNLGGGHQHS